MSEKIQLGGIEIEFLVETEDSNGSQTVFECTIDARSKVPAPHSHDGFEETIYGLEGVCTWTVDGETHEIGPGDAVCIRRGQVHGFDNRTDAATKFLAIATPGVFGPAYFRDLRDVAVAAAGGPPDLGEIMAVMRRHGLTPVRPAEPVTQ
jgi:quercetin dioxygenase-like cupin family protein